MDTTAVTIVSVLVAGVAGPGITAWATSRGQRRRSDHERDLHDVDDLRDLLSQAATVANEIDQAISDEAIRHEFLPESGGRQPDWGVREPNVATHELSGVLAQVEVRLGPSHPASRALRAMLDMYLFLQVAGIVDRQVGGTVAEPGQGYQEATRRAHDARDEFISAAADVVGSRLLRRAASRG